MLRCKTSKSCSNVYERCFFMPKERSVAIFLILWCERVLVTRRKARLGMNIFDHENREENNKCDCTILKHLVGFLRYLPEAPLHKLKSLSQEKINSSYILDRRLPCILVHSLWTELDGVLATAGWRHNCWEGHLWSWANISLGSIASVHDQTRRCSRWRWWRSFCPECPWKPCRWGRHRGETVARSWCQAGSRRRRTLPWRFPSWQWVEWRE